MTTSRTIDPVADAAVGAAMRILPLVVCPSLLAGAALVAAIDVTGARVLAGIMVVTAAAYATLGAWWWRRPDMRAHTAAAAALLLLYGCLSAMLFAVPEPTLATIQALLVIGTAAFLADSRWMWGTQLAGLALWGVPFARMDPTVEWELAGFIVFIGYCSGFAVNRGLVRGYSRVSSLAEARRQETRALRASEARLREAQRIAHVGSYEWDMVRDELWWSAEHCRIFGWDPAEPVNNERFMDAVEPEDRPRLVESVARGIRERVPMEIQFAIRRPDGERRILFGQGETTFDAAGRPIRHAGTSYDVTELRRTEQALRASEKRLTALLTAMDAARAVLVNRDGTIGSILGTATATGKYGLAPEGVEGRTVAGFLPGEPGQQMMAAVRRVYETGEGEELEATVDLPGGTFHFNVSLRALHTPSGEIESAIAVVRDATRLRTDAEARRRAQKLESLGLLAGGVAHDFNNLLVGILSNAELALDKLEPSAVPRSELEDILRASVRAAELTQELLTYAGAARLAPEALELGELVEETARLLGPALPKHVGVRVARDAEPIWIRGDAAQIRQVVMNFIFNAGEATPEGEGRVEVTVGPFDADRAYLDACYLREGLEPGRYASVEVRDHGTGMDRRTLEQVFDPFFTTKGQGRGLGLAATVGIVRNHGGTVQVTSRPEHGTTVRVLLPGGEAPSHAPSPTPAMPRTSGTVLVVDDQDVVRQTASRLLEAEGYRVVAAASGPEAMDAVKARAIPVDLALVDLTMPEMDGEQTFEALRGALPDLPVLFMSGHSSDELSRRVEGKTNSAHLKKPFRREALAQAVANLLAGRSDRASGRND